MKKLRSGKQSGGQKGWKSSAKRRSVIGGAGEDRHPQEKHPAEAKSSVLVRTFKPIKRRRRRRIRLGEAFRKVGLDEQTVAETYVSVVERLRDKTEIKVETAQKLLVDVLKECSRILEPPRGAGGGLTETPAIVELHHEVARPEREILENDADGI